MQGIHLDDQQFKKCITVKAMERKNCFNRFHGAGILFNDRIFSV